VNVMSGHDELQAMLLYDQSAQNGVPRGVPQNGSSVEEVKTNAMSRPRVTLLKRRPKPKLEEWRNVSGGESGGDWL
jgi:hypothetical protein